MASSICLESFRLEMVDTILADLLNWSMKNKLKRESKIWLTLQKVQRVFIREDIMHLARLGMEPLDRYSLGQKRFDFFPRPAYSHRIESQGKKPRPKLGSPLKRKTIST